MLFLLKVKNGMGIIIQPAGQLRGKLGSDNTITGWMASDTGFKMTPVQNRRQTDCFLLHGIS